MALKPLNSVGGFSVGEVPANIILANGDITASNATFSGNLLISNATAAWGVKTDNLYYSNGTPWDFQQAAGANGELQFNMGDDFAASPNLTFDNSTQLFTVTGNANITGTLTAGALNVDEIFNGNSNVAIPVANGNVNISVSGNANVLVVTGTGANVNGYVDATGNVEGANLRTTEGYVESTNASVGLYLVPANAAAGIVAYGKFTPNSNVSHDIGSTTNNWANVYANNAIIAANIQSGNANLGNALLANYGNFNFDLGVTQTVFAANLVANVSANVSNIQVANFVVSNLTPSTDDQYSLGTTLKRWKDINISGNANIATLNVSGNGSFLNLNFGNLLTGNFANFANDVVVQGNIANANNISVTNGLSANTGNFSGNIKSLNANLGNLVEANYVNVAQNLDINGSLDATNANFVGNISISNTNPAYGIKTDNLYYSNGQPWDLQEAAGSNNEVQFNSNDNFAASANFTFNPTTDTLTVTGNANVTNNVNTPNVNSGSGNLTLTANSFSTVYDSDGNVTFPGNVTAHTFYGNINGNITTTAANTSVLFSDDGLITGASGFTFDKISNLTSLPGNLDVADHLNVTSNANINGVLISQVEIVGDGNGIQLRDDVNGAQLNYNNLNYIYVDTNGASLEANAFIATLDLDGNFTLPNNLSVVGNIANANNISVTNALAANTGNFSGNLTSQNANLGNLVLANFVNVASNLHTANANVTNLLEVTNVNISSNLIVNNLSVNLALTGNTANFSGNAVFNGANVTVGNALLGNTANFSGNLIAANANLGNLVDANFIRTQELFNGNSNIQIAPNGNIALSVTGLSNVFTFSNVGANVIGYVTANGNGTFGALHSNTLTAQGGNLTVYAAAGDNYVELRPSGNGQVDVGNFRIQSLANPVAAQDAATKFYVDTVAEGLHIHASCGAATPDTLANVSSGTVTYNNGTAGVGATLVTTGTYTLIDGVNVASSGFRILVKNETNAAHNGIYTYTNSTTLTRAADFDTAAEIAGGDFVFVTAGTLYNSTGWVNIDEVTTVGTDPIVWEQFSGAGTYQAGAGLTLTGTIFSVNVDNLTTEIAGGNVVVKANAQLTTPNIGAATGTSLDLTGNLLAGNVNSNAKITAANIEVTSNVIANNFSANSNITANNASINLALSGNTANFTGNVILPNLTINTSLTGNTANFSGNVEVNNLDVNLELSGNTANFSGNIVAGNISTSGSGGNITGANVVSANTFVGNLDATTADVSANLVTSNLTVNLETSGNTANFSGNVIVANFVANGVANVGNLYVQANVTSSLNPNANLAIDLGTASQRWGNVYAGNIDASGNLTLGGNLSANNFSANTLTANTSIDVGNTAIYWGQVTTNTTTANQTVSTVTVSGVTGIEWIVKGIDSTGSKYSMAIVTAVTDGTSVDYSTFGTVNLNGTTGSIAVNIVGSNVDLQVTPASSNSTVWVTQYRTI